MALCLAAHEPEREPVISLAGVVDLQRPINFISAMTRWSSFCAARRSEVPDHYREADPMQLSIPQARQWLIHGLADDDGPSRIQPRLCRCQAETERGKEDAHLLEIPGAGHMDLIDPHSTAWTQVVEAMRPTGDVTSDADPFTLLDIDPAVLCHVQFRQLLTGQRHSASRAWLQA